MAALTRVILPAALALLAAGGAGFYALPRCLHPEPAAAGTGADWTGLLGEIPQDGFERPTGRLVLPDDHGAHPAAFTETWTVSAHLRDDRGADIGVQFVLIRVGLMPPDADRASVWGPRAVYRAHVTLVDGTQATAVGEERLHRDVPGVAGHDAARRQVWLDDWTLTYSDGPLTLTATVGDRTLELALTPAKDTVDLSPDGAPFRGYAITRMAAEGVVAEGGEHRAVSGTAWLDHLWGDVPLPVGPIAGDRLLLQLDDGTDLTVTRTRRRDGGGTATVAGFVVDPDGGFRQIGDSAAMEATRTWRGNAACDAYPLDWRLSAGELDLTVTPVVDDQLHAFAAPVWSGAVTAEGRRDGEAVSGRGTLLLTGYADR